MKFPQAMWKTMQTYGKRCYCQMRQCNFLAYIFERYFNFPSSIFCRMLDMLIKQNPTWLSSNNLIILTFREYWITNIWESSVLSNLEIKFIRLSKNWVTRLASSRMTISYSSAFTVMLKLLWVYYKKKKIPTSKILLLWQHNVKKLDG